MTDLERRAAQAVSPDRVTYLPATWAKRFGRAMAAEASLPAAALTDKQRDALWRQVWKFRRQIPDKNLTNEASRWIALQQFATQA
jgi:hypothetical protein